MDGQSETSQFLFLIGTGRCGSSLIQEILARHPGVGFLSNLEDRVPSPPAAGRWNNALYQRIPAELTRKGRIRYAPSEGYRALEREVSGILGAPFRDLTAQDVTPVLERRMRDFFEERARLQGKPLFVHKFTGWPRVGFVNAVLPRARFVHVVRDGRAVANSFLQTSWWRGFAGPEAWGWGPLPESYRQEWEESGRSFVLLAGLHWKLLIDATQHALAQLDEDLWIQIRYEDFVREPRKQLRRLLDFAALRWDPELDVQLGRYRFDQERTGAFEKDFSVEQLAMLEDSLSEHLAALGY